MKADRTFRLLLNRARPGKGLAHAHDHLATCRGLADLDLKPCKVCLAEVYEVAAGCRSGHVRGGDALLYQRESFDGRMIGGNARCAPDVLAKHCRQHGNR